LKKEITPDSRGNIHVSRQGILIPYQASPSVQSVKALVGGFSS
jgi:hypothetical protein